MPQILAPKSVRAALAALCAATAISCSRAETPAPAFTSAGRGAPVVPAIPWESWRKTEDIEAIPPREITGYPQQHWLVGPLDGPATTLTVAAGAAKQNTPLEITLGSGIDIK